VETLPSEPLKTLAWTSDPRNLPAREAHLGSRGWPFEKSLIV